MAAAPAILLDDDFNDGDFSGWTIVDEGPEQGPSDWRVAGGVLRQDSNIHELPADSVVLPKRGTYALHDGGAGWTDYRVQLTIESDDDDAIGLMFRVQDSDNYYRFSWDRSRNYQRLVKNVGGVFSLLDENATGYASGTTYQLEVIVAGSSNQVLIDDVLVER